MTFQSTDYISLNAQFNPNSLAIVDLSSTRSWSYAELHSSIGSCVSMLAKLGLDDGDRLAIIAKNRAEFVIIHMACVRMNIIFVPLNWRLARSEIENLLADSQPALTLADHFALEKYQDMALRYQWEQIDEFHQACSNLVPNFSILTDLKRPSLILYTSGTSGKSKGVLLSETNVTESAINFSLLGKVSYNSAFLCEAPMFHTIGLVASIRPALMLGAKIYISDGFIPERTLDWLCDSNLGITHYFCVPQMAGKLRSLENFSAPQLKKLTAIFTGGAPHPPSSKVQWLDDDIPIVDGYGMSEVGTVFGMPRDIHLIRSHIESVGLHTPRMMCRLVDDDGRDVEIGSVGELWLKGPNVCLGYWRQPELKETAFSSEGWFKTGDLFRRNVAGYYRIVGRKKDMYISGGENVYPAEIEALVAPITQVEECALVGVPDEKWGEVGCLFVVAKPNTTIDAKILIKTIAEEVARYKLPRHVLTIDRLPRNANGKVLKHVLRERIFEHTLS